MRTFVILGLKAQAPVITGNVQFAFVTAKQIKVNISHLHFISTCILNMTSGGHVTMNNVHVVNTATTLIEAFNRKQNLSLDVNHSVFRNTSTVFDVTCFKTPIRCAPQKKNIHTTKHVQIYHSTFNNTGTIILQRIDTLDIHNCTFNDYNGTRGLLQVWNSGKIDISHTSTFRI